MNSKLSITHQLFDPLTNIEITFCIYSLFFNVTAFIMGLHFLMHKTPIGC